MVFLAETRCGTDRTGNRLAILGFGNSLPVSDLEAVRLSPAPWLDDKDQQHDAVAGELEEFRRASRVWPVMRRLLPTVIVTDLAERLYLRKSDDRTRRVPRFEIFTCGPTPMLRAVAARSRQNSL